MRSSWASPSRSGRSRAAPELSGRRLVLGLRASRPVPVNALLSCRIPSSTTEHRRHRSRRGASAPAKGGNELERRVHADSGGTAGSRRDAQLRSRAFWRPESRVLRGHPGFRPRRRPGARRRGHRVPERTTVRGRRYFPRDGLVLASGGRESRRAIPHGSGVHGRPVRHPGGSGDPARRRGERRAQDQRQVGESGSRRGRQARRHPAPARPLVRDPVGHRARDRSHGEIARLVDGVLDIDATGSTIAPAGIPAIDRYDTFQTGLTANGEIAPTSINVDDVMIERASGS